MNTFARIPKEKQIMILNAATDSFADKGYYGASIKEICENASISNGALYKYFTNKEDLFLTVLQKCHDLLEKHLYQTFSSIEHSLLDTTEKYLQQIIFIYNEYPSYIKVYANFGSNQMEQLSKRMHKPFAKSANYIHHMVAEAIESGEVRSGIEETELAFLLDNYFILFLNSLVSEYHEMRFRFFLKIKQDETLTNEDKIQFILNSIKPLLTNSTP